MRFILDLAGRCHHWMSFRNAITGDPASGYGLAPGNVVRLPVA
jgi:hypothetical protein